MIIWTGKGFLPLFLIGFTLSISSYIFPAEYREYSFMASFFVSGLVTLIIGIRWNRLNRQAIPKASAGREAVLIQDHSLFWIKMEYWGLILCSVGSVVLFQCLAKN